MVKKVTTRLDEDVAADLERVVRVLGESKVSMTAFMQAVVEQVVDTYRLEGWTHPREWSDVRRRQVWELVGRRAKEITEERLEKAREAGRIANGVILAPNHDNGNRLTSASSQDTTPGLA